MIHRWLDVFFEFAVVLVVVLIAVPATVGALGLLSDRSQVVTAQVWADHPSLLAAAGLANQWSNGTPASDADALLTELVGSDWFVDQVLSDVDKGYSSLSADRQSQQRATLRQSLRHTVVGDNILSLSYSTEQPSTGRAVLSSVIVRLGDSVESLESIQTTQAVALMNAQVSKARDEMKAALDAAGSYATGKSLPELVSDPEYQTLQADALAATNYYESINYQAQHAQLAQSALPSIRNSTFHVMDAPAVSPRQVDLHTPAVKYALYALAGTAGIEFLIVYVIGLRDPRIRSGDEVRKRLGVPYVGSTPRLRSAA